MPSTPLLQVKDLHVSIRSRRGLVHAVNGVNLTIAPGEIVGVAGESGCGKSTLCHAISRSLPTQAEVSGQILFEGEDLYAKSEHQLAEIRGRKITMILQNPMTSLDPVFRIEAQLREVLKHVVGVQRSERGPRALELLKRVHIRSPEARMRAFPHQLSGGMRQRVVVGMATAAPPRLVLADEPTTALDVTVQEQILDLFRDIRDATRCAILIVTHDLGVIRRLCDRAVIMYAGRVVEDATVQQIFECPKHPYTAALIDSLPRIGEHRARLRTIEGAAPDLSVSTEGCDFAPRCHFAATICLANKPRLLPQEDGSEVACVRHLGHINPSGLGSLQLVGGKP